MGVKGFQKGHIVSEEPYIKYSCKFTNYSMSDNGFCSFGARMDATQNIETCICCGEIIPEGRQVCPKCEKGE